MTPSLKVKVCVLEYVKDLLVMMPVDTISNPSPEMIKGITRVIAWSTEPKSADVRRVSRMFPCRAYFMFYRSLVFWIASFNI